MFSIKRCLGALYIRVGTFALIIERYPVWVGWHVNRWSYRGETSWRHGNAYLGRYKLIW